MFDTCPERPGKYVNQTTACMREQPCRTGLFRLYATLEKQNTRGNVSKISRQSYVLSFPKFPSDIHVINRSDRNPPITAR